MAPNPLGSLFGKSPIAPIQAHMAKAQQCAEQVKPFLDAVLADDWQKAEALQREIRKLENEADDLKKQVRINLPKSLFLPVPRSDLLDLITVQDRIANSAKDIAGLMLGRKMTIPPQMASQMRDYLDGAVATTAQAGVAIEELDELLETGFKGREVQLVEKLIEKLDQLEHDNDEIQVRVRATLFGLEHELPPVHVVFLYKIIDLIGDLADYAQRVGARLQILIAR